MSSKFDETMKFNLAKETTNTPKEIFTDVFQALKEKGYDHAL